MGARGRKSSAELTIVGSHTLEPVERPQAPPDLTKEQASEWSAIVNRMPSDWFGPESYPILAQYCRHIVSARRVADIVARFEGCDGPFDFGAYEKALRCQDRESKALANLATKMRLSQQSAYDQSKRVGKQTIDIPPWQEE